MPILRIVNSVLLTLAVAFLAGRATAAEQELTFFGWSDQHVRADGDGRHLLGAIDAMNALPGTRFPESIGGTVATPSFVIGCGDITDVPTAAAIKTYDKLITGRLKYPSFDVVGNHDEGGLHPTETVKKWHVARYGSLCYTIERGGVHFVVLFAKYDESLNSPAQAVHRDALEFLRKDLAVLDRRTPVVVALHLCYDAITNRDEFVKALGDANVILILGGHYHKAKVTRYHDLNFVQLPSPAPNGMREMTVLRIGPRRLVAIPYRYDVNAWSTEPQKILDVPIRGPVLAEDKRRGMRDKRRGMRDDR